MKSTRKQLLTSAICLLLCFSTLLGTTFAWFTDVAISGSNVIQTGSLDAEMYWSDDLLAFDSDAWKGVENNEPIFTYNNWEPGYSEVKYVMVKNEGDLSFKWMLSIEAQGEVSDLADVIDVYYVNPVTSEITTLAGRTSEGNLAKVLEDHKSTDGVLLPEGESAEGYTSYYTILAIAFHMQEEAGNTYQGTSLCEEGFSVKLLATQFSYENDSFNNNYDKDSLWPTDVVVGGNSATAGVTTTPDNKVSNEVSLVSKDTVISAVVPAGVLLNEDVNQVTLVVKDVENSKANITLAETEASLSIDVHVDGVSVDNDVVIAVSVKELLPVGLNIGNFRFYHVEKGNTVEMHLLADGATPVHNDFEYDPATGDVVLYLKSFSEVALVADNENAWKGEIATGFAGGEGTEENPYLIANADQLAYLGEVISNENANYGDKHYKLLSNINLGGEENTNKGIIFYPIGYTKVGGTIATADVDDAPEFLYFNDNYDDADYAANRSGASAIADGETTNWYTYGGAFKGIFDGNGNTIKNIYQNTWQMKGDYDGHYWNDAMGIFGYVYGGTVKNLTVDNFSSDGEFTPTGVIAAYATNSTFENIAITKCNPRVYNTGNGGIVGIGGNSDDPDTYKLTFNNITIDNSNKISALWGSWDVACGGLVGMFRGAGHVYMNNCNVAAQIDVYNDVCGNYQYYWYRYSGMLIGTNKNMTTDENGYTVPETNKFHAEDCTVHFGQWNDYYYCELVANTLASYTHDHQFSRLTKISSLDEIKSGDTWTKTGNFLLVSGDTKTCYHIVNKDGVLTQHNHADAGEEVVNGQTVLKENNQIVYLPFNQLFTGYGWGVKHIPVKNGENYAFEGVTILDRVEANSIDKFEVILNGTNFEENTTLTIGDIFAALEGASINKTTLMVFVSPVGENSTVSAIFTPDASDWTKGTLTFSGFGAAKIVITDYTYCKEAVTSVTITEPSTTDKFVANGNLSYTHTLQGGTIEKTLGDIFSEINNANIVYANIKVGYSTTGDVTIEFVQNIENWAASTIKFTGAGSVTFTINDQYYCNDATATVSVNHPANADKFTVKETLEYTPKHDKETYEFTFGQLFAATVNEFATDVVVTVNGVEYTFAKGEGWADKAITLTEFGTVTVTITDNNYCNIATATVTFNEPETEAKFGYVGEAVYYGGQTVAMSDLFAQIDDTELGNDVVVTVNGEVVYTGADWQSNKFTFDKEGAFVIVIKEDSNYCKPTTVTINIGKTDKIESKFTGDFLYRVGNANTVALGSLIAAKEDLVVPVSGAKATVERINGNAEGQFTAASDWTKSAIQFSGTGVVKVTIEADFAYPVEIQLEVVDAYNATSALSAPYTYNNEKYNVVLLNDVTNGSFTTDAGYGFYGNGFTITLNPSSHSLKKGNGYAAYIHMRGGIIDNVRIEGPVFAASNIYQSQGIEGGANNADATVNYFRNAIVVDSGDAVITNSYISGARTAICVKSGGNVKIENSMISGGAYANIEVLSADSLTLNNVVTEQKEVDDSYGQDKKVIGTGIVINNAVTKLILNGLTQYNWMTESQWNSMLGSYKMAFPQLFKNTYSDIQHTYNSTTYVNTGIIWACDMSSKPSVEGDLPDYDYLQVNLSENNGYVYTKKKASGDSGVLSNVDIFAHDYNPTMQGAVPPKVTFDYTSKNNEPEQSGSNDYCYYKSDANKFLISFDQGETKKWYSDILTVKVGTTALPYEVTVSGTAVVNSDNTITFKDAGDYVVTYTYTNENNYKLNNGQLETYATEYKQYVYISVFVVEPQADPTEFAFGKNANDGYKVVTAGGVTYVMPNVSANRDPVKSSNVVTTSGIGSKIIDGQTIYYPIISQHKVGKSSSYYNYFSVFEAVTITDANGTTYNVDTTALPENLQVIGGFVDSGAESANGTSIFNYSTGKTIKTKTVKDKNGNNFGLCYYPDSGFSSGTSARPEQTIVAKYCYTDSNGKAYYYYVGYHCAQGNTGRVDAEGGTTSCLAAGTMITLADGSKKAVEQLRKGDVVMSFDHVTGKIVYKDVVIVGETYAENYYKNTFVFDDGTELVTINEHGIYDLDLKKYVNIDQDNYADYIGHRFASVDSNGNIGEKKLVDVITVLESGYKYDIVTNGTYNYVSEDTLSVSHEVVILINTFEFDDNMMYDAASMQADIEKYGLYTYEEWAEYCDLAVFEQYNFSILKVGVGKGLYTKEHIVYLLTEIALNDDVQITD